MRDPSTPSFIIQVDTADELRLELSVFLQLRAQQAIDRAKAPNMASRTRTEWLTRAKVAKELSDFLYHAVRIEPKPTGQETPNEAQNHS